MPPRRAAQHRRPSRLAAVTASVLVVVLGVVGDLFGVAHLPVVVLGLGLIPVVATAALVSIGSGKEKAARANFYLAGCISLAILVVGATCYRLYDRSHQRQLYAFTPLTADETQYVPLSGEPGGPPLLLDQQNRPVGGLYGGHSYSFVCQSHAPDGSIWLSLEGTQYWAPAALMRFRHGESGHLPSC